MLEVVLGIALAGSLVALADVASSHESELRSFTAATGFAPLWSL